VGVGRGIARLMPDLAALPLVEGNNPGEPITLALIRKDGSQVAIHLGPAEAIAIAGDLLQAARARLGRADWPPKPGEVA
jgi:hypothetical protein